MDSALSLRLNFEKGAIKKVRLGTNWDCESFFSLLEEKS